MELTDKCAIDFNSWFQKKYWTSSFYDDWVRNSHNWPTEAKWGVVQDFFKENDMFVHVRQKGLYYSVYVDWEGRHLLTTYIDCKTLKEARSEAIEAANKIYNETK